MEKQLSGFGERYEESEGFERSRFHGLLNDAQAMMGSFFVSNYFPLMGWVDILTGMSARLEKNFKELDLLYRELIDDHLNPKRTEFMQEDILDVILQLRKD
ncbi:Cytochrome P450 83B1 [Camellia lanceoleosa]|uniref:Cytochrome P450 83B1 n=1 Tax=Camellia lanceoleosa TaxID=1840588 RepID=A0ACC0HNJ6_9ERIC|nr:Cytochrome P450 83B1 [Camellia lanceoleosa]